MAALRKAKKYNWKETNLSLFGSDLEKEVGLLNATSRCIFLVSCSDLLYGFASGTLFRSKAIKVRLCSAYFPPCRSRRRVHKVRMRGKERGRRRGSRFGGLSSSRSV